MKPSGKKKLTRSLLPQFHLVGRRVLVRIDGDVPLKNGTIANDFRLEQVLPTLKLIKEHGGKIILITHIGKPNPLKPNPNLSTNVLIDWLERHGFTVAFTQDLQEAKKLSHSFTEDILLLENLRFFAGEKERNKQFARQLAALGDFYVNEAFGVSHRDDSSIALVAKEFGPEYRSMGLRLEQEVAQLKKIKKDAKRPVVLIIGGGKVKDKLNYLFKLLPLVDTVLLCPAIVFTLLKAQEKPVGSSLVDLDALPIAHKILQEADKQNVHLIYPTDYQVALNALDGPLEAARAEKLTLDMIGIAIGPDSITHFTTIIQKAGTMIFNGTMGFTDRPETMQASYALLKAMANSSALTVVGGGDSVAAAYQCGAADQIQFLSTGGGAMLALLAGNTLPGLMVLP